jgi:hypothetical protein
VATSGGVKTLRELSIRIDPNQVADFLSALAVAASDSGWERDSEAEQRAAPSVRERIACFKCDQRDGRVAATLALHLEFDVPGKFVASYIGSPDGWERLPDEEHNKILVDFNDRVLRNLSMELNASCSLTSDQVKLEELMSPLAMFALQSFVTMVGKPRPILTERATESWHYFLVTIQRDGHRLTADLLTRWLTQEHSWPVMMAERLRTEFAFGTELLAYAAGRKETNSTA